MHFGWLPGRGRMKYTHTREKVVQRENKRVREFSHWLIERDESLASLFFRFLHPSGGPFLCLSRVRELRNNETQKKSKKGDEYFFPRSALYYLSTFHSVHQRRKKKKGKFSPSRRKKMTSAVVHSARSSLTNKKMRPHANANQKKKCFVFFKKAMAPVKESSKSLLF
jgi:hypothetical protein